MLKDLVSHPETVHPAVYSPTSSELNLLAAHRQEQLSDDGSSADENVPEKGAGWTVVGSPLQVEGLPSPGRWPVQNRRYPSTERWKKVMAKFAEFVEACCTPDLLMALAMGRVETCPFDPKEIAELKGSIIASLASDELKLERRPGDREDIPIDFRLLGLLLSALKPSLSAQERECHASQHCTARRESGGWHLRRTPERTQMKKDTRASHAGDAIATRFGSSWRRC